MAHGHRQQVSHWRLLEKWATAGELHKTWMPQSHTQGHNSQRIGTGSVAVAAK